jgi:hypothetical protein
MTSDLYNKIVEQRGSFERLVAKIPGFRGYHEKNARRKADSMLRRYLGEEFEKQHKRYTRLENKLLANGRGLKYMGRSRQVKMKMREYIDRIKTAAPKYSAMFATIKIGNDELDRIYAFDELQIRYQVSFEDALDHLEKAIAEGEEDTIMSALDDVENVANEANEAFMMRDDVILQLGSSL